MAKTKKALPPEDDLRGALRRAIVQSGLTHYRIGKQAGVAPEVIDRFVSGERDIRLATASRLATALGWELRPKQPVTRKGA